MITLQSRVENYSLSLPNSPKEITPEYFQAVTECINLPEHYAVVAVIRQVRMYDFLMVLSNPKSQIRAADVAVLCKLNGTSVPSEWKIGQQILIDEADIARGTQIIPPSALTYDNIVSYFVKEQEIIRKRDAKDKDYLIQAIMVGGLKDEHDNFIRDYPICFVSFKIIPITSIHGTVDNVITFKDPFIKLTEESAPTKPADETKEQEKATE